MNTFFRGFAIAVGAGAIAALFMFASFRLMNGGFADIAAPASGMLDADVFSPREKTTEELIAEAMEKSSNIKGLYMTADVANDPGAGATRLRNYLIQLAEETEINGMVIDVKEVCGADFNEKMIKSLITELHQKNIWAIARVVIMKDASQVEMHPEWYLKRSAPKTVGDECSRKKHLRIKNPNGTDPKVILWRDKRGGYWLDPASDGTRRYVADFSKKMIDLGFDEIQFDYVRFPSDGDVEKIIYPAWDGKTPKYAVMKSFYEFLNKELKTYKPDIILSADLFGYAAVREGDVGIGQRLEDIGNSFDYISFMVYPSHYYSGFYLPADPAHNLPAVNYNINQARLHPDVIIGRSMQFARDFLDGKHTATTSSATTTAGALPVVPVSKARLRPWLEDFYHDADKAAKRPYGAEKVRLQIDAAESTDNHGWLLWNAANIYTEEALKKE